MGLFDKLFGSSSGASVINDYAPDEIQEAYVSLLYACGMSDGDFGDEEIGSFAAIIRSMPIMQFDDVDIEYLMSVAGNAIRKNGITNVLQGCAKRIGKPYAATAFCFATEVILSDGIITDEEKKVLEKLAELFDVNEETATKIIEVMMIRAKR